MADKDEHGIQETVDQLIDYLNDQFALARLKATERVAREGANLLSSAILTILGGFFLLFLSITAGFFIGKELDSFLLGFGSVTGFYLLLFLIFLGFKHSILERPFMNTFIKRVFQDNDD